MAFASFMSSAAGRILRVIAGLALIGGGVFLIVSESLVTLGIILAAVGVVPLFAGLADVCILAPLFGAPFSGAKVRAYAR
jgi:hypothetical protein